MKKLILFSFFLVLGCAFAQISDQQKRHMIKFFKEQILKNDTTRYNFFVSNSLLEPGFKIPTVVKSISIISPSYKSWAFFVDEHPFQSWTHSCKYIFVNEDGEFEIIDHNMPPKLDIFSPINILKTEDQTPVKLIPSVPTKSSICKTSDDWAVIINGGFNYLNNHERYWNHVSALYITSLVSLKIC